MREKLTSLDQFKALQEKCIKARENEKRKVLVCCGTGCAAGGNLKVYKFIIGKAAYKRCVGRLPCRIYISHFSISPRAILLP